MWPTPTALLMNVASVGLPKHGLPLAAYTVLTGTEQGWCVEQRQVAYDPAEEIAAAAAAGLPPWEPHPRDGAPEHQQRGAPPQQGRRKHKL